MENGMASIEYSLNIYAMLYGISNWLYHCLLMCIVVNICYVYSSYYAEKNHWRKLTSINSVYIWFFPWIQNANKQKQNLCVISCPCCNKKVGVEVHGIMASNEGDSAKESQRERKKAKKIEIERQRGERKWAKGTRNVQNRKN